MRTKTSVLTEMSRLTEAWITVPCATTIQINAKFGRHFRVYLTQNAVLDPPFDGHSGQEITFLVKQDPTGGRVLTLNTGDATTKGFSSLGTVVLNTTASSVTILKFILDDETGLWNVQGVPSLSSVYDLAGAAAAAQAAAQAASQPVNNNLTAVAGGSAPGVTGLALLAAGNAAGALSTLGTGTLATKNAGAAQANSTAVDVAGIVADFNSLLAKLRTPGIIAT